MAASPDPVLTGTIAGVDEQIVSTAREMIRLGDKVLDVIATGDAVRGETQQGRQPGVNAFYSLNGKNFVQLPKRLWRTAPGDMVCRRVLDYYVRQPGYRVSCDRVNVIVEW